MERSLHQQLKRLVARDASSIEVPLGSFRIDAIDAAGKLVEVQCAPLAAIREKVLAIREHHDLRIIKPIVASKTLEVFDRSGETLLRRRRSPKRATKLDVFGELLHFTQCVPHPRIVMEFWLVDVLETRIERPKVGRQKPYKAVDVRLAAIADQLCISGPADLIGLLPAVAKYGEPFCTQRLADDLGLPRWQAQQIAFVLERCSAIQRVCKRGNSRLYVVSEGVHAAITGPGSRRRKRPAA